MNGSKIPGQVKVISPHLHHLSSLWQALREVAGCADCVALGGRELTLDDLVGPTLFVE